MKDLRISVRLSPETRRRLKAAARRGGKRESEVVREAVERQLAGLSHFGGFAQGNLLKFGKTEPKVFTTAKAGWRVRF